MTLGTASGLATSCVDRGDNDEARGAAVAGAELVRRRSTRKRVRSLGGKTAATAED